MPQVATSREVIAEIRRLRKAGMSTAEIVRKLGVSAGTVNNYAGDLTMGVRGKKRQQIVDAVKAGWSFRKIIRVCKVGHATIKNVIESMKADAEPSAVPSAFAEEIDEKDLLQLPESDARDLPDYEIDATGTWALIGDIHFPYHHKPTIESFVDRCRRRGSTLKGILLNGDTLDSHEVSRFNKDRDAKSYKEEIRVCKEFLAYLRQRFPNLTIVWKDGNHDERVYLYCAERLQRSAIFPG